MPLVSTDSQTKFTTQLRAEIARRLRSEAARRVTEFALQLFDNLPLEELSGKKLSDVYGRVFGWWNFVQERDPSQPKIAVYNPTLEQDGWLSSHTVITVLQRDMPFLVDSVRLELDRRKIAVHEIHTSVLSLTRDGENRLCELLPRDVGVAARDGRPILREAVIHMEITRHSAVSDHAELVDAIAAVLLDVALVTDDFQPMADRTRELVEELTKRPPLGVPEAEVAEVRHLLRWMLDHHYTFLGFLELELVDDGGTTLVRERPGSRLGLLRKRPHTKRCERLADLNPRAVHMLLEPRLLRFFKSSSRSRVHRSVYSDYVTVKRFDEQGEIAGEYRFLGLYASRAYTARPSSIPLIREKVSYVMQQSGFDPDRHDGKHLQYVLEALPRDELFHSEADELLDTALGIVQMRQRSTVRLFVRSGLHGRFLSCLVFMPRDAYHTGVRSKVQDLLSDAFGALESEFTPHLSESVLARTHFVFRVDPEKPLHYDIRALEARIAELSRTWEEQFREAMTEAFGEEKGALAARDYEAAFPPSYRDHFEPRAAVNDIRAMANLDTIDDIAMSFFRPVGEPENSVRFKLFHLEEMLVLSDVLPILENMGLRVVGEHPYSIERRSGPDVWIHDFQLVYELAESIDIHQVKDNFQETFASIWHGRAESDSFNRLILGTQLEWREVTILRAYARYMKQIAFHFSQDYIAHTLSRHLPISQKIVALFQSLFDPRANTEPDVAERRRQEIEADILAALDQVESLDEDRIIHRYLDLIRGTCRTNYYQLDESGNAKTYLSFKFSPQTIPDIPVPRPLCEIFVYSPRVEGVHLRSGKVARGGLRWSDRKEDYRTEILGLLKAQQVKNAVIVPVGAKGGFVAKQLPEGGSREQIQEEGIACYRTFVQGLLDLTDDLQDGTPVAAPQVVRKDDDDTYLVVAADKGTATFSDVANDLSRRHGYWLGDAFASGGSVGYDHKKMGITARGAWVSVQRHFRERGIDVQSRDFSVVGIGDMSGDVFGNGMLLSEHIELLAAFNHLEIFLDPNPDPASSFAERKRLFELPRSTWSDYRAELISPGGGVYPRSAKSIALSREVRSRLGIETESLTPNELISALLKAPVDLIWNGGIGTYSKASSESHADVGDKANDVLRVDARDLRCRVIAEGGNLGFTQLSRVEFCLGGGACDTDFIDNVGGVDCSDHEVNIKILLNEIVASGDMTEKQRRELLRQMTDSVAELVIGNSYRQVQAISIAEAQAMLRFGEYRRVIAAWESQSRFDRGLEFIPDDESLVERKAQGKALTRPELSVLLSYSKAILKEELVASDLPDDLYCSRAVETAFPDELRRKFRDHIYQHRLKREIVATQIANDLVNHMGFTFASRMMQSTGSQYGEAARAYVTARDVFTLDEHWSQIEALDGQMPCELQIQLMLSLQRLVRRGSRWFLRNRRGDLDVAEEVRCFAPAVQELISILPELLCGGLAHEWQRENQQLLENGVPEALARFVAAGPSLHSCLGIIEASRIAGETPRRVAQLFFALGEELELHWFGGRVAELGVENHWQALARESALDDLDWQQRALAVAILEFMDRSESTEQGIQRWMQHYQTPLERWRSTLTELHSGVSSDFSMYAVALRELLNLAQSSSHHAYDDDSR